MLAAECGFTAVLVFASCHAGTDKQRLVLLRVVFIVPNQVVTSADTVVDCFFGDKQPNVVPSYPGF